LVATQEISLAVCKTVLANTWCVYFLTRVNPPWCTIKYYLVLHLFPPAIKIIKMFPTKAIEIKWKKQLK